MNRLKKKLIEVALPLEAINEESAREKYIRSGHPSTLHLWWARRPLAACRAVLFASIVDDPSAWPDRFVTDEEIQEERERLFSLLESLVKWENRANRDVLEAAQAALARSIAWGKGDDPPRNPADVRLYLEQHAPAVLDPFAGGGSIPLEAQRLGLRAYGTDLNPIAVLLNKALIEIPTALAGAAPVADVEAEDALVEEPWSGLSGLARDVRHYGEWIEREAKVRLAELYPDISLSEGGAAPKATVLAWIWARTAHCPNPACDTVIPLLNSLSLCKKRGQRAWLEPVVGGDRVDFRVATGNGRPADGMVNRTSVVCPACDTSFPLEKVREEGRNRGLGLQLIATVAEDEDGNKHYLAATEEQSEIALQARPDWTPETAIPEQALGFRVQLYGVKTHGDLFTNRQICFLNTLTDLTADVKTDLFSRGATKEYAVAVLTYLVFAVGRYLDYGSALTYWDDRSPSIQKTFGLPTMQMRLAFPEANPFAGFSGSWRKMLEGVIKNIEELPVGSAPGAAWQQDATSPFTVEPPLMVSTDPPYYDNIGYAALSDYFHVWHRRTLRDMYPDLFSTMLTPKDAELIAEPARHDSREEANEFFEHGLFRFSDNALKASDPQYPFTLFYAFKQFEADPEDEVASTGWEVFLSGLLKAGWQIVGTWPIRTEQSGGLRVEGRNALASSVVVVCRARPTDAVMTTRRNLLQELQRELPAALRTMQEENIAPVDLAQAAIGPGMAIYSSYGKVLEPDGSRMGVRAALHMINQVLDQTLAEQEGDFDADTRWAIDWFEQYGMDEGPYGSAEVLSKAKNTAVASLVDAGILHSRAGKVRLLARSELNSDWDPISDDRLPIWEATQRLIRRLEDQGEEGAAQLIRRLGDVGQLAKDLAYRLFSTCERKGWSEEAAAYNSLVASWRAITDLAREQADHDRPEQPDLI